MCQVMDQALVMQKGSRQVAAPVGARDRGERLAGGQANITVQFDMCYDVEWTFYRGSPGEEVPVSVWGSQARLFGGGRLSYDLKVTRSFLDSQVRENITGQG